MKNVGTDIEEWWTRVVLVLQPIQKYNITIDQYQKININFVGAKRSLVE